MRESVVFVVGLALYFPILRGGLQGYFFPSTFFGGCAPLILNSCAVVCALALLVLTKRGLTDFLEKQHLGVAVGCFASMMCLVNCLSPSATVVALCAPLVGLYFCYASACWGVSLVRVARHNPWRACLLVACAYVVSYVAFLPVLGNEKVTGYLYALLPALSMLLWATHWSSDLRLFPDGHAKPLLDSKTAASIVVLIGVFEVVSSIAVGIFVPFPASRAGTYDANNVRTYLSLAVAVVLLVLIAASARFPRVQFLAWGIAIVFVTAGVMLFALGFESAFSAGCDILSVGRRTAWVLLFMLLAEISMHDRDGVVKVYGCLFPLIYEATRIPINALRFAFHVELVQEWLCFVALGISMVLMLAALVWCGGVTAWMAGKREEAVREVVSPSEVRGAACARMAERFALTECERATFEDLSQGHTVKHIAETRCVAESTVRSHVKAIYRKTGCHSKQELIDRVAAEMDDLRAV